MSRRNVALIIVLAVLLIGGAISLLLPQTRRQSSAQTSTLPEEVHLIGSVRDFMQSHVDFGHGVSSDYASYAGLVLPTLGPGSRPVPTDHGRRIEQSAVDASGRPIPPHLANRVCSCGVTNFEIIDGVIVPGEPFGAEVSVLGAAIETSSYDLPVTVQVQLGSETYEPWGPSNAALAGNVNDDANPRRHVLPSLYGTGTTVTVTGTSWLRDSGDGSDESDWSVHRAIDSLDGTPYVKVLRNGDEVPDIDPFNDQGSITEFVQDYIHPVTGRIALFDNQVIFLYELGVTNLDSPAADFQDLVVVMTFVSDLACLTSDTLATYGPASSDAYDSEESFEQWFRDEPGVNMSRTQAIVLEKQPDNTYLFDDRTRATYVSLGGFYPIDDALLGNEGAAHNENFTYRFDVYFTYHAGTGQYFTYTGNGDMWVFVSDRLGMDLGGLHGPMAQRLDLNRLCLVDGQRYLFSLCLAHRHHEVPRLRIETNIVFEGAQLPTISNQYD